MMRPEMLKLLERYHDRETSAEEAAEVEALLERDVDALDYLGMLDEMSEFARASVEEELADVSFDGLWEGIQAGIRTDVNKSAAITRLGFAAKARAWIGSLFADHKGAWIAATAAASAVALVMAFFGGNEPPVIEKHIIIVESVDQVDPNNLVMVNSLKDDNTAVIWMLPNSQEEKENGNEGREGKEDSEASQGIQIVDEPL